MAKLSFLIPINRNLQPLLERIAIPNNPEALSLDTMQVDTAMVRRTLVADGNGMAWQRVSSKQDGLCLPFPFAGENQLSYDDVIALCDQAEAAETQSGKFVT